MIKRILLASLIFISQSDCMSLNLFKFEYTIGEALNKLKSTFMGLPVSGKVIACGAVVVGTVGVMIMAGKKEDKLPFEDKYPDADYPYKKPKRHKGEDLPRRKNGDYIDDRGDGWRWDPVKDEWDVQVDPDQNGDGKTHVNVNEEGNVTHTTNKCSISDSIESNRERRQKSWEDFNNAINNSSNKAEQSHQELALRFHDVTNR